MNTLNYKCQRRGFTILEIIIVLAVIAILAAILIPSFVTVGQDADLNSDKSTVENMNTTFDSAETLDKKPKDPNAAMKLLAEGGYAVGIHPNTNGYCYVWDKELNRVLMVDVQTDKVVYPENYVSVLNTGTWHELSQNIPYPCPVASARVDFVNMVLYYRGELKNAPAYVGKQSGQRYIVLVAEVTASIMGYDKSDVCYAIYDSNFERLITPVVAGYSVLKRTYNGTIENPAYDGTSATQKTLPATACRIVEVAEGGTIIDFFAKYVGDSKGYYFCNDGRLDGELDTAKYLETLDSIVGNHVYMYPMFDNNTFAVVGVPVEMYFTVPAVS